MEFVNINILWNLIWVLPLLFTLTILATKKRKKYLKIILGNRYSNAIYISVSKNKRIFRIWIMATIAIFLVIAAARPYWGYRLLPFSGSGRDILAVIDVSKSMLSKDIRPTRLAHAKLLLKNLIKKTPGDRYGILAFAGTAFLECPLTIDRTSLFAILKDINTDSIPIGSTNIEKALNVAIKAFKAATGGYKAIILITDGDELQGTSSNVISTLKEIKTPLFVVGIGDPSKPGLIRLPTKNGQSEFLRDSSGELVKSKLDETHLKQLAKATNGIYIRSTAVDPGLKVLQKKISQLIPEEYKNGKVTRPLEKLQIPLLLALFFIFIWLAVGELNRKSSVAVKRKRKISSKNKSLKRIVFFLSILAFGSNCTEAASNNNPINRKSNTTPITSSETSNTIESDKNIPTTKNTTPIEEFNLAVTSQAKGDFKNAVKQYTEAINLGTNKTNIRSKSYQNMGVIQHMTGRKVMAKDPEQSLKILSSAENLYKEAMRSGPLRKKVAINQQILLKDKKKANEIIKRQKEIQKKREEARKKTEEALKKQQDQNNQKKNDQQEEQQEEQQKNKPENSDQQNKKQQKQEMQRKTSDAQRAVQDYKESAKQNSSQQDIQTAQGAADDIKEAQENQLQNKNTEAEKNLKEAMNKLIGDKQQEDKQQEDKQNQQNKNDQNKQQDKKQKEDTENKKNQAEQKTQNALDKQQQANQSQDEDKKKKQKEANKKTDEAQKAMSDYKKSANKSNSQSDKQKAEKASQNINNAKQNQDKNKGKNAEDELKKALDNLKDNKNNKPDKLPEQPKDQTPAQSKNNNKKIDPKQAEALLKLMAEDEKSLKEELKKRQKAAYGNMPVDKDW